MASLGALYAPVKVKGIKTLVRAVGALTELVVDFRNEMRTLVTNVERLGTALDNIQGDVTGLTDKIAALEEAATTKAAADAATIAQLRSDVDAATAAGEVQAATITSLNQAVADAEASLATAQADFDATVAPLVAQAEEIAARTPEDGEEPGPAPEPTPEPTPEPEPEPTPEPTPQPEPAPEPTPDQPAPPVEEPADPGDVPPTPPQV